MEEMILEGLLWLAERVPEAWRPYVLGVVMIWVVVTLAVSKVNGWLRKRTEAGKPPLPGWALKAVAFANVIAMNPDKALQLWQGYRGKSLTPGTL